MTMLTEHYINLSQYRYLSDNYVALRTLYSPHAHTSRVEEKCVIKLEQTDCSQNSSYLGKNVFLFHGQE